jgi:hypothetical protein
MTGICQVRVLLLVDCRIVVLAALPFLFALAFEMPVLVSLLALLLGHLLHCVCDGFGKLSSLPCCHLGHALVSAAFLVLIVLVTIVIALVIVLLLSLLVFALYCDTMQGLLSFLRADLQPF